MQMIDSRFEAWSRTVGVFVASGLLALSSVAQTNQSQQRQAGRDVNQSAKHDARTTKVDCRAANQQSNAACRHDKRDTKQEGRQDKRDIKY
jgi:hypothetical protein